jgi:hypothetical protein
MGASANSADDAMEPPIYAPGDTVRAKGRYGTQTVDSVMPNVTKSTLFRDGHLYFVKGGKGGRQTSHYSDELQFHRGDDS